MFLEMMGTASWGGISLNFCQTVYKLPIKLNPARLDDGSGIEETRQHHYYCRIIFNSTKLQSSDNNNIKVPLRITDPKTTECFLCEETGDSLRQSMTIQLTKIINDYAKTLNDGKLLAKLSSGDAIAQELKYHPSCLVALYNTEREPNWHS